MALGVKRKWSAIRSSGVGAVITGGTGFLDYGNAQGRGINYPIRAVAADLPADSDNGALDFGKRTSVCRGDYGWES